ncbi:Gfo/Idh/MocA family protein [Actibacterium ureilyticum]|uniref:Gfo/Idh/MocA family protein n=1 Tax=Actibacterium ureilyticum TaxID=1590614 RepID=UPI000BAB064B|nr:Gfo/Idh/MocA family oxidoreductase [Actibacterium ureilyticum]
MDVVNWGILGAAKFAREHMAPAINMARGARLAALATSSAEKANGFSAFCPDIQVYSSYDDLLAAPEIDALYIPLPNHLHVEWTQKALRAGKHVLCEKPIAMQADQIDALIALRDETGLLAAEAYMIVHHPQWQRAKHLIADGAIGNLIHVDGTFSYDNRADTGNIRNKPETGGGALPDIGVYTLGSARFATGQEPETVEADIAWENGVDVTSRVIARFPGFSYNCMVSMRMHPRQEMNFHGDAGLLRLTAPFNPQVFGQARIELHQPGLAIREERFPAANHYVNQVEAFCHSLRTGDPYPWRLEDARGTQAVIDRAFAAAG